MLLFAERTGSKEAHELGSRLEKEMLVRSQHSSLNTPFKSTRRPGRDREGLKWEDTICEWIEATPDMVNLKHEAKAVNGESMRSKEGSARWGLSTHSNTVSTSADYVNLRPCDRLIEFAEPKHKIRI
jgi:hypothetical protein